MTELKSLTQYIYIGIYELMINSIMLKEIVHFDSIYLQVYIPCTQNWIILQPNLTKL